MNSEEREPTRDELLAMAYVDGELDPEARRAFEARLGGEPALAREVAQLRRLEIVARGVAPPEPMDHEWSRLERELLHAGGRRIGLALVLLGALGVSGWSTVELVRSEIALVPKLCLLALVAGAVVLFLFTLRARLRTLPYDPYTDVER